MGKIFCFIGKSASGKDSVFKALSKEFPEILEIVPYTTRPIRKGEMDGISYHFVTNEIYHQMLSQNQIIEARSYNTKQGIWTYFTAVTNIDLEHHNYMTINTLIGYQSLKKYYGDDIVIPIYIEIEDEIRLQRAINRERSEKKPKFDELCRRFLKDQKDFNEENLQAANITKRYRNYDLLDCIHKISSDIHTYLDKTKQYQK
ncbi:MAG: guanylate kinase [bacterium]|nr:guanylate kinase [bacterium]